MNPASRSVQELHEEHREWLSDLDHWTYELNFLEKLLNNAKLNAASESMQKAAGELENRIQHHKSLLKNLRQEIHSHEAFIKDQLQDDPDRNLDENDSDHNKNRQHVRDFKKWLKTLKNDIYQFYEELL